MNQNVVPYHDFSKYAQWREFPEVFTKDVPQEVYVLLRLMFPKDIAKIIFNKIDFDPPFAYFVEDYVEYIKAEYSGIGRQIIAVDENKYLTLDCRKYITNGLARKLTPRGIAYRKHYEDKLSYVKEMNKYFTPEEQRMEKQRLRRMLATKYLGWEENRLRYILTKAN